MMKSFILVVFLGLCASIFATLLILDEHPVFPIQSLLHQFIADTAAVLPSRVNGIIAIAVGSICLLGAMLRLTQMLREAN